VRPLRLVVGLILLLCSPLLAFEVAVYALSRDLPRPEPVSEPAPALFVDALWLAADGPPAKGIEFWWLGNLFKRPAGSAACQTIARQLVRRSNVHHFKTLEQHARVLALAVRLCRHTSEDELKLVLAQQCYFGREAFGPRAAAEAWFQKSPEALSVAEIATLAGLPNNPSLPTSRLRARRAFVLTKMANEGLISRREEAEAKTAPTE
jgi:membrane carboxypeptidase/penicillin-binding protein